MPEFQFDIKQQGDVDDLNGLFGFGLFLTFRWYF